MHVLLPSGSGMYPHYVVSTGWDISDGNNAVVGYFPYLYEGSYRSVEVNSFFHSTHGRKYNDVCHGKPTGFRDGDSFAFFDGGQFFPCNNYRGTWRNGTFFANGYFHRAENFYCYLWQGATSGGSSRRIIEFQCLMKYFEYIDVTRSRIMFKEHTAGYQGNIRFRIEWNRGVSVPTVRWVGSSSEALLGNAITAAVVPAVTQISDEIAFGGDLWYLADLVTRQVSEVATSTMVGLVQDEIFIWGLAHMIRKDSRSISLNQGRSLDPPSLPEVSVSSQIFAEDEVFLNGVDPIVATGKSGVHYWRSYLLAEAYYDACRNVPRLSDNSISNIIEIAGFIKGLVIDHRVEIPRSLSQAWLSYRYRYGTGKMDAEEAIKFVHRHMDLQGVDQITSYGRSSHEVSGTEVTCQCCFHIAPRDVGTLARLWRALGTYGLQPSFYAIWDMIPFSFVVDWLIPIGEIASRLDATRMYSDTYYNITDIQFSLSYDREGDNGLSTHWYTRWCQGTPPQLLGVYAFEDVHASSRTVGYRILDTAALIIG